MQAVVVCERFGWTYDEYLSQPVFFMRLIREKIVLDAKAEKLRAKQNKRG